MGEGQESAVVPSRRYFLVNIILLIRRSVKRNLQLFCGFPPFYGCALLGIQASFRRRGGWRGGCASRRHCGCSSGLKVRQLEEFGAQ